MIELPVKEKVANIFSQEDFFRANEGRDYQIYIRSTDAALWAKAESILPYFEVEEGDVVVDAGSGSGGLAELIAQVHRGAVVYAVDVSHELMEIANESRSLASIVYGDATKKIFPDDSIKVKYYSTSGHEIVSFGGNMREAVEVSYSEIQPDGRLIIRDFAKPEEPNKKVLMSIYTSVGFDNIEEATVDGVVDYSLLSTKALFLQFHKEFAGGNAFDYEVVSIDGEEFIRLTVEWAHEFYLRKDYTANWRQEIKEKYTYWTLTEGKEQLEKAGFVDVVAIADPNEYILENRLRGKIGLFIRKEDGSLEEIDFPTTHMVLVGTKPRDENTGEFIGKVDVKTVDYGKLKETIIDDVEHDLVKIGDREFKIVEASRPILGSKRIVYALQDGGVLKVVRNDCLNDHNAFKSMYQSIERENLLDEFSIPHLKIVEKDPQGPPYRYFTQDALPEGAICAAMLIEKGGLSETDIQQMASYVNRFEISKTWQLDTNPFNWFRVYKEDGSTVMTYVDGKVYKYDENWEFRKIGLLQWVDSQYVSRALNNSAQIPRNSSYIALARSWVENEDSIIGYWKKYLNATLQPILP